MSEDSKHNDLQKIITQSLEEMKREQGEKFSLQTVNLAELERRTGISRSKLRTLKKNDFHVQPHGLTGRKATVTVLTGFTGVIDDLLRKGVTNSSVCLERITDIGYTGSLSQVKDYIQKHRDLVPAKRQLVAPQGNRGRRYRTGPGEAFQMDWGFADVETDSGSRYRVACFAMICHHCGERFIEFFPNAKQENLFIGMLHSFVFMGIPKTVLTDNMKSVVIGRDPENQPIWQKDYEVFMDTVGFETKLCKPRHPFTKGAVERLVRFVKENFLAGRTFSNITDLNCKAHDWCCQQNRRYHACVDCIPEYRHLDTCLTVARVLEERPEFMFYLCPERRISFDGYVNFEGRRFGVPYWYVKKTCRISRDEFTIRIYSSDLTRLLTTYDVTWSRADRSCKDQYVNEQPEERPSVPVTTLIRQKPTPALPSGFEKFNFAKGAIWDE